ncbi:hypothetical protein [Scytonema sp. NUACC26]|uniref:hypothetical protein n=1 Tax=Scytonema sp. NUACC26 TaxID=3140176 RepID=UPI0034DB9442
MESSSQPDPLIDRLIDDRLATVDESKQSLQDAIEVTDTTIVQSPCSKKEVSDATIFQSNSFKEEMTDTTIVQSSCSKKEVSDATIAQSNSFKEEMIDTTIVQSPFSKKEVPDATIAQSNSFKEEMIDTTIVQSPFSKKEVPDATIVQSTPSRQTPHSRNILIQLLLIFEIVIVIGLVIFGSIGIYIQFHYYQQNIEQKPSNRN